MNENRFLNTPIASRPALMANLMPDANIFVIYADDVQNGLSLLGNSH